MLAIYQGAAAFGDKAANIATMRARATEAKARGAELVVFPELFLTGYNHKQAIRALAEARDGASVAAVAEIAREIGIAILFGFPEIGPDRPFNTIVLLDRDGTPRAFYRKFQLFGADEQAVFAPGDELVAIDFLGTRIGFAICYDIEFPELARALTQAGAKLILVPTANMLPLNDVPTVLVRARALENGVAVAYANLVGTEDDLTYCGLSAIIAPDGRELARADGTETGLFVVSRDDLFAADPAILSTQLRDARDRDAFRVTLTA